MSGLAEVVRAPTPSSRPMRSTTRGRPWPAGSRATGFMLEAVYEGYLMHYGEPRAFAGMDQDLRLLAGDALYALASRAWRDRRRRGGGELADLISLSPRPTPRAAASSPKGCGMPAPCPVGGPRTGRASLGPR